MVQIHASSLRTADTMIARVLGGRISRVALVFRRRQVKFNTIGGVGLLCCSSIKVGKLIFVRILLAEDPKRLSGDGITLGRDAMAVGKYKDRGYGWFLCG